MANSAFSKIVKSLWVLVAFIPIINGLGFAYIGAKEFNGSWIREGLIYELPWFLLFLFSDFEEIGTYIAFLALFFQLICIIRTFLVYFNEKDVLIEDDPESEIVVEKSISSFWVLFSIIPYLNGLGIIIIGVIKGVRNWIFEGLFFEFLWILTFVSIALNMDTTFPVGVGMVGLILSIVRTFMIYFEAEKMDMDSFKASPNPENEPIANNTGEESAKSIEISEIIPEFMGYNDKIIDLKDTFKNKEGTIRNLIDTRFKEEELSYDRFKSVIDNCHKIFYHHADSALKIIQLAPEFTERLDESVKGKISILESINDEMNNLIEELIIHDGTDDQSEDDLKELFDNMDNLIGSVKDYK